MQFLDTFQRFNSNIFISKERSVTVSTLRVVRLAPEWQSHDVAVAAPQSLVSGMGVEMGTGSFIHWSCNSQWIGAQYQMGKTTPPVWSLRRVVPGRAHRYPQSPTPLGPAGTPLVPALTHSTSGSVTGNNVRLGTSKDLSAGHETRLRRFGDDDNTCQGAADECSD